MKLYLVQHGEAVAEAINPGRPLSDRGRTDVSHVAAMLKEAGVSVMRVLHSGKTRAEQTAEILAKVLAPSKLHEAIEGINPNDAVPPFARQIEQWSEDTLVVGHLPFMSRLVALLVTGDETKVIVAYQQGSVVCLERAPSGAWLIDWMVRPEL